MKILNKIKRVSIAMIFSMALLPFLGKALPTKLRTQDCNNSCANLTYGLVADAVVGATQYEFELRNSNDNTLFASKIQTSRTLVLGTLSPVPLYGAQYIVSVRANVGGSFGSFGLPCTITLISDPNNQAPPATQLRNGDCNSQVLKCGFLFADPVSCATKYEFEISDGGGVYATKIQTNNQLAVWSITPAVIWQQTYQVRVRAYRGNVAGPFGASCNITIAPDPGGVGFPTVNVAPAYQNGSFNLGQSIFTTHVTISQNRNAGITRNDFDFDFAGSTYATYVSNTNKCPLGSVTPALIPGNTYQVRVRPWICNDHIGPYGSFTNVTILSGNRYILHDDNGNSEMLADDQMYTEESTTAIEYAATDLQTAIFPQPANTNTALYLYDLEENESYTVQVFDLNGKSLGFYSNLSANTFQIPLEGLDQGLYFVEVKTNLGKSQRNKLMIAH